MTLISICAFSNVWVLVRFTSNYVNILNELNYYLHFANAKSATKRNEMTKRKRRNQNGCFRVSRIPNFIICAHVTSARLYCLEPAHFLSFDGTTKWRKRKQKLELTRDDVRKKAAARSAHIHTHTHVESGVKVAAVATTLGKDFECVYLVHMNVYQC